MLAKTLEFLHRRLKAVIVVCVVLLVAGMAADTALRMTSSPAEQGESVAAAVEHGAAAGAVEHGFWARAYHLAETLPVFWTLFGVLGCVLLVIVSKGVLAAFVAKREDYYGE